MASNNANLVGKALAELVAQSAGGVDWLHQDPDITRDGSKIILPNEPGPMPLDAAIDALQRKKADEETEMAVVEIIDTYPTDGAVAFVKAMKLKYGWASPIPKMTFFGPQPPELRTIETGPGESVQVPWGMFTIPGIENPVEVSSRNTEYGPQLGIFGRVKKREQNVLRELAELTREILRKESIYKGKAIRLRVDPDGDIDHEVPPTFLPTAYINPAELVLNDDEMAQIETALWAPIRHTAACVKHGIPLKRGVLLEGTYGTGKTMTANVTSAVCVHNGWTFILLDDVRALKEALLFAKRYSPAVIFAEDIDRLVENRDEDANDLLNTIDGVLSKDSKVITVLTTNFVEKLDKAMLRPGRLDAVVSVKTPDPLSVARLINIYARGLLAEGQDLSDVGLVLAGNIPATIREVVERSKLGMINRGATQLTAEDLLVSAKSMAAHLALLADVKPEQSMAERLGSVMIEALGISGGADIQSLKAYISLNSSRAAQVARAAQNVAESVTAASQQTSATLQKPMTEIGRALKVADTKLDRIIHAVD